ncbi:GntR family transcriptional regulator [Streptomyces atriruber]|uniref:GntR family transcriptional regulator n=1 Tax=Streptomyces atriruber TaxID=545121 RepID=A0ABV3BWM2_9ACTN
MTVSRWAGQLPTVKSKADLVHESLRTAIADGTLAPGERVNMDELARSFGVSKIPVREAVKRLESQGLLTSRIHSGVTVAGVDRAEMRGVFLAREAIEGLVSGLAAENTSAELLHELARIQKAMRKALAAGTLDALPGLNSEFHQVLACASGYRTLAELTEQLLLTIRRHRVTAPMDETNWQSVIQEHGAIIEAVRRGDARAATTASRAHTAAQSQHEAAAAL